MKRLSSIAVLCLFALASTTEAQNDSPPGYADVVIAPDSANPGRVVITIESVEDPANGRIRCGRSADDKCAGLSRITWSVQNNSPNAVTVRMTNFRNESTNDPEESPFNNDPQRPNIQNGQRRPIPANVRSSPTAGTYKYDIVVYDQSGNEIGKRDPRIDI